MTYLILDTNIWIYLLTNQLESNSPDLHFKVLHALKQAVTGRKIAILVNSQIHTEWENNKDKAANQGEKQKLSNKLKNNLKTVQEIKSTLNEGDKLKMDKLFQIYSNAIKQKIEQNDSHIQAVNEFLKYQTQEIPITETIKARASDMAVAKKAPFIGDKSNSMADALIFLSAIEYLKIQEVDGKYPNSFFISANKGDFCQSDKDERLHEDLRPLAADVNMSFSIRLPKILKEIGINFSDNEVTEIEADINYLYNGQKVVEFALNKTPLIHFEIEKDDRKWIIAILREQTWKYGEQNDIDNLTIWKLIGNNWQIVYKKSLQGDPIAYVIDYLDYSLAFDKAGKAYIYLLRRNSGIGTAFNGSSTLEFILVDWDSKVHYILTYSGKDFGEVIQGEFENYEDFIDQPNLIDLFEQKFISCEQVYQQDSHDFDLELPENYDKKWIVDNPMLYDFWDPKGFGNEIQLNYTYYDDLSYFIYGSGCIENKDFMVYYGFAASVIGFNKKIKKYFPIWIPERLGMGAAWGIRSLNAEFDGEAKIIISNAINNPLSFDLDTKIFTKIEYK